MDKKHVGGNVEFKRTAVSINSGSQTYDLNALVSEVSESGQSIEVKKFITNQDLR